jgi:hypothetical protein
VVDQALYAVDTDDPVVVDWFLAINADHLGSGRVTQPVLLMCGEHDSFQPPHPRSKPPRSPRRSP